MSIPSHSLTRNSLIRRTVAQVSRNQNWYKAGRAALLGLPCGLCVGKLAHADEGLSRWDKDFLVTAIESDNPEIKAGEIALQRSSNPDVKSFAQHMVDTHSKTSAQLKQLAAQRNVTAPTEPRLGQRTKIELLANPSGASFDQHYVDTIGVAAHHDAAYLSESASNQSKDADIKQFAAATLPILRTHLANSHQPAKQGGAGKIGSRADANKQARVERGLAASG